MNPMPSVIAVMLLATSLVEGQEPPVEIPPVERTSYSIGGLLEVRPSVVWMDTNAAAFKLKALDGDLPDARANQLNSRLQLDAGYQRGWFGVESRTVMALGYADGGWDADATAYEAYVSLKAGPALTIDAGKKTLKWGKGYIWNPAAFLDRPKNPEDPALALEGFVAVSADYIRTFDASLQVVALTPVLVPVYGGVNEGFGEDGHLNAAAKLYLLLFDTDVDLMFLSGGSRPSRVGFDFSRNILSNLEVHGEWARVPRAETLVLNEAGALMQREAPATNFVVGVRYLSETNTTFVVDYYRNGAGLRPAEMDVYFQFVERAYQLFVSGADDRPLAIAAAAAERAYGRMTPMRSYVYARATQPDAFGVLYLSLGASAMVNAADGSFSVLPEVQYKPTENLELRWFANIQRGGHRTEFGEKQGNARLELRARYYF